MTTIMQGGKDEPVPVGWIIVHDSDVGRKDGKIPLTIRASSIDAMHPRKHYTTLDVCGHWIHVKERIGELTKLMERAEADLARFKS